MNRALILACGNSLRGDDGAALHVLDHLRKRLCDDPAIDFHFQQQWTPELAEPISRAATVIFVDAAVGMPSGSIAWRQLQPSTSTALQNSHHATPEALLMLAEQLYGKQPRQAFLVTIAGAAFELNENLSDTIRGAIPLSAELIEKLLFGIRPPQDYSDGCTATLRKS